MAHVRYSSKRQIARPAGLGDYLWSCVLDDYLSEEEDNEFSRIIGKREDRPFFWPESSAVSVAAESEDPRSVWIRGGSFSSDDGATDNEGMPRVWSMDQPDVAPMVWLTLPKQAADDSSELSHVISVADRSVPNSRTKDNGQPNTRTHPALRRDKAGKGNRSSSHTGSRARSRATSRSKSRTRQRSVSRGRSQKTSKSVASLSRSIKREQEKELELQRQAVIGRERSSRGRSIVRAQPDQRQPSSDWARDVDQQRQATRRSTRSVVSRQRSTRSSRGKDNRIRTRRNQEERSMKSSYAGGNPWDMPWRSRVKNKR